MFLCTCNIIFILIQYLGLWVVDKLNLNTKQLLRYLMVTYPHLHMSTHWGCVTMSSNCFSAGRPAGFQGLGLGKLAFVI